MILFPFSRDFNINAMKWIVLQCKVVGCIELLPNFKTIT